MSSIWGHDLTTVRETLQSSASLADGSVAAARRSPASPVPAPPFAVSSPGIATSREPAMPPFRRHALSGGPDGYKRPGTALYGETARRRRAGQIRAPFAEAGLGSRATAGPQAAEGPRSMAQRS